ncbi:hypothetical protein [Kitasatospora sp. NPDC088548]|uniref:hypothetical protein n=1 Tax=Kitasatospora sp. NPDC088548 TaxID=3364075 RepID=UPI0038061FED
MPETNPPPTPAASTTTRDRVETAIRCALAFGADPADLAATITDVFGRASAELDQVKAELAVLRVGEEQPHDERLPVTPAQWLWYLNRATPDQRLEAAHQAIEAAEAVYECQLADHGGQVARVPALQRRLSSAEEELSTLHAQLRQAQAQRDEAIRFIAALAGQVPAFRVPLAYRPDPGDPIEIVFLRVGGQLLQWCIEAQHEELFAHVEKPPSGDGEQWLHRLRCSTPEALRTWAASSQCAALCCSPGPATQCLCGPPPKERR